jgi:hypothetical protein
MDRRNFIKSSMSFSGVLFGTQFSGWAKKPNPMDRIAEVPSIKAKCPPAEPPKAPILSGSMPYFLAFALAHRTAVLQSCTARRKNRFDTQSIIDTDAQKPALANSNAVFFLGG